jgi:hypothetical protein
VLLALLAALAVVLPGMWVIYGDGARWAFARTLQLGRMRVHVSDPAVAAALPRVVAEAEASLRAHAAYLPPGWEGVPLDVYVPRSRAAFALLTAGARPGQMAAALPVVGSRGGGGGGGEGRALRFRIVLHAGAFDSAWAGSPAARGEPRLRVARPITLASVLAHEAAHVLRRGWAPRYLRPMRRWAWLEEGYAEFVAGAGGIDRAFVLRLRADPVQRQWIEPGSASLQYAYWASLVAYALRVEGRSPGALWASPPDSGRLAAGLLAYLAAGCPVAPVAARTLPDDGLPGGVPPRPCDGRAAERPVAERPVAERPATPRTPAE